MALSVPDTVFKAACTEALRTLTATKGLSWRTAASNGASLRFSYGKDAVLGRVIGDTEGDAGL
jgi:hypothetical protein